MNGDVAPIRAPSATTVSQPRRLTPGRGSIRIALSFPTFRQRKHVKPRVIETAIGRRIRHLRQRCGLSLDGVAAKAGVSRSLLSKIENGRVSSPIATLANVAVALDTTVARLIGAGSDGRCVIVRRDERRRISGRGSAFGYGYEALGHKRLDKRMEPYLVTYPPGLPTAPRFTHRGEAFLFVLRGRVEFHHDSGRHVLGPGDSAYFDNEVPHGARALGRTPALALVVTVEG
jgi:transcriptional regulator with XRE-family HTH domain